MVKHIILVPDFTGTGSMDQVLDANGAPVVASIVVDGISPIDVNAKQIPLCCTEFYINPDTKEELPLSGDKEAALHGHDHICESCEAQYLITDLTTLTPRHKVYLYETDV